jgi:hypothetical protein
MVIWNTFSSITRLDQKSGLVQHKDNTKKKLWSLYAWKSIGFQILLRTKYVPSLVKIHWRMLILECSQGLWRTDGSVTISPRNFVGGEHSRINILQWMLTKLGIYLVLGRIWNPIDFPGHRSKVNVTGSNFPHVTSLWTL